MDQYADSTAPFQGERLSIIMPAFNEAATIKRVLERVRACAPLAEIIVIDDGSIDETGNIAAKWASGAKRSVFATVARHSRNLGKGAAIRTGLDHAHREFVLIQDADEECDPADIPQLWAAVEVCEPQHGDRFAVFGTRFSRLRPSRWTVNRAGVAVLNATVRLLYGRALSDEAVCYKLLPRTLFVRLNLQSQRFEFCPEVTAKLCRLKVPILEVPIRYSPRSRSSGKKLRWRDGWLALWTLWIWRLRPIASWVQPQDRQAHRVSETELT